MIFLTVFTFILLLANSQAEQLEYWTYTKQNTSFIGTWPLKDLLTKEDLIKAILPIFTLERSYEVQNDDKITNQYKSYTNSTPKTKNTDILLTTTRINNLENSVALSTTETATNNYSSDNDNDKGANTLLTTIGDDDYETSTAPITTVIPITDQFITNKYKEEFSTTEDSVLCSEKNERYPIPGSCDRYRECRNRKAEEKQCPDGLRYNHNIKPDLDPCQYPPDVQCANGSTLQVPKPTENCPNQFGYFKTADIFSCSSFRICEKGIGYEFNCEYGLAFNSKTYRCEWPDKVPDCKVEALLDFVCPKVTNPAKLDTTINLRSPKNCKEYFSCTNGKPRKLVCDDYFAFSQQNQTCVPAYEVEECPDKDKYYSNLFVRRRPNGEYFVLIDDGYFNSRAVNLRLDANINKRKKVIS